MRTTLKHNQRQKLRKELQNRIRSGEFTFEQKKPIALNFQGENKRSSFCFLGQNSYL